jgi:hypothetical protein
MKDIKTSDSNQNSLMICCREMHRRPVNTEVIRSTISETGLQAYFFTIQNNFINIENPKYRSYERANKTYCRED